MSTLTSSTAWTPPNAIRMLRISTRGVVVGPGSVAGAIDSLIFVSLRSGGSPADDGVEADRGHQHRADDDVLDRRINAQQEHARPEGLHHDGAVLGAVVM